MKTTLTIKHAKRCSNWWIYSFAYHRGVKRHDPFPASTYQLTTKSISTKWTTKINQRNLTTTIPSHVKRPRHLSSPQLARLRLQLLKTMKHKQMVWQIIINYPAPVEFTSWPFLFGTRIGILSSGQRPNANPAWFIILPSYLIIGPTWPNTNPTRPIWVPPEPTWPTTSPRGAHQNAAFLESFLFSTQVYVLGLFWDFPTLTSGVPANSLPSPDFPPKVTIYSPVVLTSNYPDSMDYSVVASSKPYFDALTSSEAELIERNMALVASSGESEQVDISRLMANLEPLVGNSEWSRQ